MALFMRRFFEEVHYRPGNPGAKMCRDEFEDAAKAVERSKEMGSTSA